jgi:aspartyl-tRNA(Asn)/glutamyl-tRNA(Gln) amidotransferase subunit A
MRMPRPLPAGARITRIPFPVFAAAAEASAFCGNGVEAFAWHRDLLARAGDRYDPRIKARILRGGGILAADYLDLLAARRRLIAEADEASAPYDALMLPTCPILPPPIAALGAEAEYNRVNLLSLRNTALGNFLDRCAISLPCHREGEPPVGLMLMGETMGDRRLFTIAAAVEAALRP